MREKALQPGIKLYCLRITRRMTVFIPLWIFLFLFISPLVSTALNSDSLKQALHGSRGTERLNILRELSAHYSSGDITQSIYYDSLALITAIETKDLMAESNIRNNLGISYYTRSEYARAIRYLRESLDIKEEIRDTVEIVKSLNNLGSIFQLIGDYRNSLLLLNRSLTMRRAQNDSAGIARTLSNLSVVYNKTGNPEESLRMLQEAGEIFKRLGTDDGLASVYNNMGTTYQALEDFIKAEKYFLLSLSLKDESADPRSAANTYNNLGMVAEEMGNYRIAKEYYTKAFQLRTEINDRFGLSTVQTNLGRLNRLQGRYGESEAALKNALRIAQQEDFIEQSFIAFRELSFLYAHMKRFDSAYAYSVRAMEYQGKLFHQQLSTKIAELDHQRKTELLYNENELLRLDNSIKKILLQRKQSDFLIALLIAGLILALLLVIGFSLLAKRRTNRRLRAIIADLGASRERIRQDNETKDKFFSIIAHDLRSPFNSILGLSELMMHMSKSGEHDNIETYAEAVWSTSRNTFNLLENLLEWAHAQTGAMPFHPHKERIAEIVAREIELLNDQADKKQIRITRDYAEDLFVSVDRQMFGSIIRNLVSNAVKFSWKGGEVVISATVQGNDFLFMVKDHGIGIPEWNLPDLFSGNGDARQRGTDHESGTGLGMLLCREFTERHGGTICAASEVGLGTTITVSIPLDHEASGEKLT
jgi:signal transduction histidine kinase